jgi:hypothetical protein
MAERKVKWSSDKGILSISSVDGNVKHVMNLVDLFPGFFTLNETQQHIIEFGVKQAIADDFAAIGDENGKLDSAKESWSNMLSNSPKARKARSSGSGLEDKLAEAEIALNAYIESSDADKLMAAKFGINRTLLQKKVDSVKKAIVKRDAEGK